MELRAGSTKDSSRVKVKNLRTGAVGDIVWNSVLPVGPREVCDCGDKGCRCVYEDYDQSEV